jgi:carboxypeptidase PM20D1
MRKLIRLTGQLLLLFVFLAVAWTGIRLIQLSSRQMEVKTVVHPTPPDSVVDRLAAAIRIPTFKPYGGEVDSAAFRQLDTLLAQQFPQLRSELEWEQVGLSHLLTWKGRNNKLTPILLTAHLDVVPVDSSSLSDWEYPPFSGTVAEGYLWGRGSLDDKMSAWGLLEAIALLVADGYRPERTVMLAFGHDEETGGSEGAQQIAALLAQRGIEFEFVLDEGTMVVMDGLSGLDRPLALVSIAEKGYASYQLIARSAEGGHSSMPNQESAIEKLASALAALEADPFPALMHPILEEFFSYVGPEMDFVSRAGIAALPLTESILMKQLTSFPAGNAMVRTTLVPTSIQGGVGENVLPQEASVVLNARILPGYSLETTREYIEYVVDDPSVEVSLLAEAENRNPSAISSSDSFGFQVLQKTSREIFPDAVVAPGLLIAASDGRHYHAVSQQVYRFTPIQLLQEDLSRLHGVNERISIVNYKRLINFYRQLILNSCK